MATAKDWTFRQLGSPNKLMVLSGWSAPFGRQRKSPIMADEQIVRQKTTYYPGTDAPPTRHVFGIKFEPWELKGRFMDTVGGKDYAKTQTAYVRAFVKDQQPVQVKWGDILVVNGFIEKFKAERESEFQVAWTMTLLIDEDVDAGPAVTNNYLPTPKSYLADIVKLNGLATTLAAPVPAKGPSIKPSLLDSIDNLVSSFNSAIANLVTIVNSVDSFERALVGDVKRLRAGIGQVRTAAISLRNVIASIQTNSLLISRSAGSDIQGLSYITQSDVDLVRTLGAMAALDRQAEIAERGKAYTNYVVQLGDTWESISTRFSGGPNKAATLRELNNAKYGAVPEPGRVVKVPIQ